MTEIEKLKQDISELSSSQTKEVLDIWKVLNELTAENRILSEVVQSLAVAVPDLNPVMSRLLDRKDELVSGALPGLEKLYAEKLERWHTFLLYAQRIEQKKSP